VCGAGSKSERRGHEWAGAWVGERAGASAGHFPPSAINNPALRFASLPEATSSRRATRAIAPQRPGQTRKD
jgi:hypothetical protein